MREALNISSAGWLTSAPIPISHYSSILSAFIPGTAKVVRFTGPHRFYRAAGWDSTKGGMASRYGSSWADEEILVQIGSKIEMFEGWLPEKFLQKAWPAQYRGMTSLCEDWNDMRKIYRLELSAGEVIVGLVGSTQPQKSTMDAKARSTPMFQGGGEQVFFKRTRTLNSINPLWIFPVKTW